MQILAARLSQIILVGPPGPRARFVSMRVHGKRVYASAARIAAASGRTGSRRGREEGGRRAEKHVYAYARVYV